VTPALIAALKAKHNRVRAWAADELGKQKGAAVLQALIPVLADRDGYVRRAAADSLKKLGDKAAVPALIKRVADDVWLPRPGGFLLYRDEPYDGFRGLGSKDHALDALRQLAPEQATTALQQATKSGNAEVRKWAEGELRKLGKSPGGGGAKSPPKGWVVLFDGKSLRGWEQRNGTATYRVEDGCIVGKTTERSANSFLCTIKEYGDFELKFEVLVDDRLNSGVQIRSRSRGGARSGRVEGPQVEIAADGNAGFLYGEALDTGWLTPPAKGSAEARKAFRKGEWNSFHVKARGRSIQTWVNGVPVADLAEDRTGMRSGFIGLQVHAVPRGTGPYEVRWRNIWLLPLKE
jgi:hypothetical protein